MVRTLAVLRQALGFSAASQRPAHSPREQRSCTVSQASLPQLGEVRCSPQGGRVSGRVSDPRPGAPPRTQRGWDQRTGRARGGSSL